MSTCVPASLHPVPMARLMAVLLDDGTLADGSLLLAPDDGAGVTYSLEFTTDGSAVRATMQGAALPEAQRVHALRALADALSTAADRLALDHAIRGIAT